MTDTLDLKKALDGLSEEDLEKLSSTDSKAGRLQRACLALLLQHREDGAIPTSGRFIFYELEGLGIIPKEYRKPDGTKAARQPAQDVSEALTRLRETGIIPWDWLVDETRNLDSWPYASSVYQYQYVEELLPSASIGLWQREPPPLILCESRSLAGVLRNIASSYLCPIAATNGQVGGFLRTDVGPMVKRESKKGLVRVLYFGDLDLSGGQIEENTKKVLEDYGGVDWERIAITDVQVRERNLTPMDKLDKRYKPARPYKAVETEALRQVVIQDFLREALKRRVPQPLEEVHEEEDKQRLRVREALASLNENGSGGEEGSIPDFVIDQLQTEVESTVSSYAARVSNLSLAQRQLLENELRRLLGQRLLG